MIERTDAKYPIGKPEREAAANTQVREGQLSTLAGLPDAMRAAVDGLSDEQLDTPYREGGWTVRQVVHHVADSHGQMVGRVKMALTEDNPTIKPYDEKGWAQLADSRTLPVEPSLAILDGLHLRLLLVLRGLSEAQWGRAYLHPERGPMTLAQTLALYDWHSRHHVAHVTQLRKRMGW